MQLQLQTFAQLVGNAAAAVQGSARQLVDLTVGSTLRAVLEANASVVLWLQWLILQVLRMTRAATSDGVDLDSWMADFSLTRLPAAPATGLVTFARFTPSVDATVPVGTGVRTADGTQSYSVYADAGNAAFNAVQGAYVLPAGVTSVTVPVSALVAGSAGNVQAGTITLISAALPGVDTVVNGAGFLFGFDAETDASFRGRFQGFLASRSRATVVAIGYAISAIQQGLQFTIQENVAPDGSVRLGNFLVTVDDGSGAPSAPLLATVAAAVEMMRPIGSTYAVNAPTVIPATITMAVVSDGAVGHPAVTAAVSEAVGTYANMLPIGAPLAWSRLSQVAYDASSAVTNVRSVLLNGSTADLVPSASEVVRIAAVTVS